MSYQGINFANQRLVPSDDGRLYQKIFNDGALYGCELSYSGAVLFLSPGFLIVGGREIELDAAEQIPINEAISGFAQLVISIDLTQTATKDSFKQVSMSVRYAAAEDGFATLVQDDINGSGSRYEAQLALVSLGAGGITGIIDDMPQAAFRGAADGINLKVVGGTEQPISPAENTVWVNTDTAINGYAFSADEPASPAEGMVWINTATESATPINVGKKNTVMLYPVSCKQYISGAWVTKIAMTYQGGAWKEWLLYFYNEGDKCEDVTGGWTTVEKGFSAEYPNNAGAPSVSYNVGNVKISQQGNKAGLWYTKNKISLTGRKKLTVKTTGYTSNAGNSAITLCLKTGLSGYVYDEVVASQSIAANGDFSIDLSALSASDTKYHVCIAIYSTCSITVEKLYAE